MAVIGIDTHKRTLAACAVDGLGSVIAERVFRCDPDGLVELARWARPLAGDGRVGVEGSASYGAAVARLLIAAGLEVREVPPHLSRHERGRTRRPGKSDPGDALAIARVTLRETGLPPVRLDDRTEALGLLVDAREELVQAQTRARNRLHAHLVVLVPGYGDTAARLVTGRQLDAIGALLGPLEGTRAELARSLLEDVRSLGARATALEQRIAGLVAGHPVLRLPGVGVHTAAWLIAEAGDVERFASPAAFAMLAGVAPVPASSGESHRMRLNRGGNRRLNRALYTIALAQAWHHPPAKAYLARKRAAGMSWAEALRCLKHRIARPVFRLLQVGQAEWAALAA
jgi:transposase